MNKLGRARVTVGIIVVAFGIMLFLISLLPILSGSTADFYQLFETLFLVGLGIILISFGKFSRTKITREWVQLVLRLEMADLIFEFGVIAEIGVFAFYVYLSAIGLLNPIYFGMLILIGVLGLCLIVFGSYLWVRAWQQRPKENWTRRKNACMLGRDYQPLKRIEEKVHRGFYAIRILLGIGVILLFAWGIRQWF